MAHPRQQIREAFGAILSASVAGLWNHVFESRIKPTRSIAPFLMVFIDLEENELLDIHPTPRVDRSVQVTVEGYLKITDDEKIEDDMDAMAAEIETLLTHSALDTQLGGKLHSLILQSSSLLIDRDETERTHAQLSLSWQVRVMTIEGTPETLR